MVGRLARKLFSPIFLTAFAVQNSPAQQPSAPPSPYAKYGGVLVQAAAEANDSSRPRNPQSSPGRKDIPAIAKAANGAIVSIVMSDKDGHALAQGSGFLVSKDGLVVTNYHVIAEGTSAVVKLPEGAFYIVEGMVASDKARDVAVIKTHGKSFRTLTLGNSDRLQVGEEVVAIGNPLSLESTVSNGIVSGIRTVEEEGGNFLQITTPISPGSSGGPLFNMAGEVVGITTLYLKGGENLNFAIPINDVKRLLLAKSSKIQDLPNEVEKGTPKEAQENRAVMFHVESFDPHTDTVIVRLDNRLFTATVLNSVLCNRKPVGEFDWKKDCEKTPSVAGELVGQDIRDFHFRPTIKLSDQFYALGVTSGASEITLIDFNKGETFHSEIWRIEKVEAVR
jgi:S1-C subfamily serine protease